MSGFHQDLLLGSSCQLFFLVLRDLLLVFQDQRADYLSDYFHVIEKTQIF